MDPKSTKRPAPEVPGPPTYPKAPMGPIEDPHTPLPGVEEPHVPVEPVRIRG